MKIMKKFINAIVIFVLFFLVHLKDGFAQNKNAFNLQARSLNSLIVMGDAGVSNSTTDLLRSKLKSQPIFNIILLGDNLYNPLNSYEYVWNPWLADGFRFPLVTIGNHNGSYEKEIKYFQMPSESYFKVIEGALFIVLNSDNKKTDKDQIAWLEQLLSKANHKLIYIMYHHPSVTLAKTHAWEEKLEFQNLIRKVIKKYSNKITAIMNGHDHAAGFILLDNKTPIVLNGAIFESYQLLNPLPADPMFQVTKLWSSQSGYWFSRLDFDANTGESWIHYIRFDSNSNSGQCSFRLSPKPILKTKGCN